MSIQALNWAREQTIKGGARFVLMLANRANPEYECWPRVSLIARDVGTTVRTVQRALRELERAGLVLSIPQFNPNGSRRANKYRLLNESMTQSFRPDGSPPPSPPGQRNVIPLMSLRHHPGDTSVTTNTTVIEASNKTSQQHGDGMELILPNGLTSDEMEEALKIVKPFSSELAQRLLDEFAGKRQRGSFQVCGMSWFRAVAKRASAGEFYPALGLEIRKRRDAEAWRQRSWLRLMVPAG